MCPNEKHQLNLKKQRNANSYLYAYINKKQYSEQEKASVNELRKR